MAHKLVLIHREVIIPPEQINDHPPNHPIVYYPPPSRQPTGDDSKFHYNDVLQVTHCSNAVNEFMQKIVKVLVNINKDKVHQYDFLFFKTPLYLFLLCYLQIGQIIRPNVLRAKLKRRDIAIYLPAFMELLEIDCKHKVQKMIENSDGLNGTILKFNGRQKCGASYIPRNKIKDKILEEIDTLW